VAQLNKCQKSVDEWVAWEVGAKTGWRANFLLGLVLRQLFNMLLKVCYIKLHNMRISHRNCELVWVWVSVCVCGMCVWVFISVRLSVSARTVAYFCAFALPKRFHYVWASVCMCALTWVSVCVCVFPSPSLPVSPLQFLFLLSFIWFYCCCRGRPRLSF